MPRLRPIRTPAARRPDPGAFRDVEAACRIGLTPPARRPVAPHDGIADPDGMIAAVVEELASDLPARRGNGRESAARQPRTAGDGSGAAALRGVLRGALRREPRAGLIERDPCGGAVRAAERALHIFDVRRLRTDPRTQAHAARRIAAGPSKREAIRALKRRIARALVSIIAGRGRDVAAAGMAA